MPVFNTNIFNELEVPTVVLSTRYHKHLGTINNIDTKSINVDFNMASAQEISFDVYKKLGEKLCSLWDSIVDFKYIYVPQYDEYYEISVSVDEDDKTVKHVYSKSACEAELSQRYLRNFECNTESDILRDDYVPTKFYDKENTEASLLHRVLKDKCPDYTIKHVDPSLINIQRSFSVDNISVYDFFSNEVAKEIGCLFVFDSVNRAISVYDLKCSCKDCGTRAEFKNICKKCGSSNITYGYGNQTNIFISTENFADSITVDGDVDNVKNCFKIEGGDDLMTATVANINPNSSEYIYHFSEDMKSDMPDELVEKLNTYNNLYNSLLPKYEDYTERMYEKIDREIYLTSEMMPKIILDDTTSEEQLINVTNTLKNQTISVQNINTLSSISADLAVNGMAKVIVDARYKTDILSSTLSDIHEGTYRMWTGKIKVTDKSDDEDFAESTDNFSVKIVGNDYEQYLYQKIQKSLNKEDSLFTSIFEIENIEDFKLALKDYCLDRLKSFESSYQTCIEVLIENGVTDENSVFYDVNLYDAMYKPYYDRIIAIQEESVIRESEISEVVKEKENYQSLRENIQKQLDFKKYIGNDFWNILCSYIREDTYSNSNYISDGLNNSELIEKAKELFNVACDEIYKASELQVTLSDTLENLISTKEFKDFKKYMNIGNWITNKINDILYRLRLINISIDFGNTDKISVSFSNVEKMKDVISDTKSVLDQAKSMASSFSYIEHQASQGQEANDIVEDYRKTGLDAALYNIVNSGTQDVKYDEHGISCRKYDDILGDYLPEQLRIINNTIAFTSDNWKTTSAALGKLKYKIDGVEYENYGLNADHVVSGTIVGGDIYSGNYSSTDKVGMHIGLNDSTIQIGGDALTYDIINGLSVNGKIVATSGKSGDWDINKALYSGTDSITSTKAGTYIGIDGIRNYKDSNHYVDIKDGTLTSNNAIITGGLLNINTDSDTYSIIRLNNKKDGITSQTLISPSWLEVKRSDDNSKYTSSGTYTNNYMIISYMDSSGNNLTQFHANSTQIGLGSTDYSSGEPIGTSHWILSSEDAVFKVTVYTPDGTVSVSDKNNKNTISELDKQKTSEFIYSLKPSQYKLNNGTSNRLHHGLIAQEVKESMKNEDWGLYVDTSLNNDNFDNYKALRYEELIADLIATVQLQNERILNLERTVKF